MCKLEEFFAGCGGLGVEVDCSHACEGKILIRNKQGRVEKVCAALEQLFIQGYMSRKEFSRIMGRLQYADSQVMGKSGRLALAEIRRWAKSHDSDSLKFGHGASHASRFLSRGCVRGTPREVPCLVQSQVWHVFTDGAAEGDSNTIGVFCIGRVRIRSGSLRARCLRPQCVSGLMT